MLGVFRKLGFKGLQEKKVHGAVSKLSEFQKNELRTLIHNGAIKYGFEGDIWNRKRVKFVIEEKFGIVYCERQADRIMKKMGYTIQTPQRKDYRQKEEDIKHRKETTLPAIKKKRKKKAG